MCRYVYIYLSNNKHNKHRTHTMNKLATITETTDYFGNLVTSSDAVKKYGDNKFHWSPVSDLPEPMPVRCNKWSANMNTEHGEIITIEEFLSAPAKKFCKKCFGDIEKRREFLHGLLDK